jgi:hypothetical protein
MYDLAIPITNDNTPKAKAIVSPLSKAKMAPANAITAKKIVVRIEAISSSFFSLLGIIAPIIVSMKIW